jgi:GAF domain-containing protein
VAREVLGYRTVLMVPMVRRDQALGIIAIWRREQRPFSPGQIALVETFADQAVIAIENVRLFNEIKEALDRQTATADILRLIGTSPTDAQPVFEGIARSAVNVCAAFSCAVFALDGDMIQLAATHGVPPERVGRFRQEFPTPLTAEHDIAQTIQARRVFHLADIEHNPNATAKDLENARLGRYRTRLMVPMVRGDRALGLIAVTREDPTPFPDQIVELLKTFADQAVIAIENVRLFTELQEKNRALTQAHAQVSEALEQQTATADILSVISGSPTDVQPVFDAVAESAARLCESFDSAIFRLDGDHLRLVAHHGPIPAHSTLPLIRGTSNGRAVLDGQTVHVADIQAEVAEFPEGSENARRMGHRTVLSVPLMRQGVAIGTINVRRTEARLFTERQVALLQTFADQAVIAIENVRLFNETKEALEKQTATAEVLRVISQSPTDVQPVFDAIVDSAVRLCDAAWADAYRFDGERQHLVACSNLPREGRALLQRLYPRAPDREAATGRAILDRAVIHVPDTDNDSRFAITRHVSGIVGGASRSVLAVPMLHHGEAVGVILVHRGEQPRPFSSAEIDLLKTFADQAVIAIENVRLFKELDARTQDLTRSVGELRALSEVGQAISSTLDLQTVLSTIAARATQLSGTDAGVIYEYDEQGEIFVPRATEHLEAEIVETMLATPVRKGEGATGRLAEVLEPVQVPDILAAPAESRVRGSLVRAGYRALLAVPLVREDLLIGGLTVIRKATGEFGADIVELLKTFATQSALAIQNARLFREIEQKSRELEAASRHKSEFLANMSHELRTPLNAVIGFSEVLTERMFGELNEKQDEYLKDIHASGQHLLSLINDILDLSKIEAGKMELELSEFDLPMTIDNALMLVRERATRRNITLNTAVDEGVGQVHADERKIRQVLLNLLSNAIKFTPEGRIHVEARFVNDSIEVSVTDTGVGIAPEDQEAVFEEFRQVGTADKKVEGTGLGLALSRKFIELHGGKIWVKSQVGQGSTFTFTVPVRRGE